MSDFLIWPAVAVICIIVLGIFALIFYKAAISRLIDRINKADRSGITFDKLQEGMSPQTPSLSFDDLMQLPITASVLDREKNLKTYFQTLNLKTESAKNDVLIRALSFSRLENEFNNISYSIFGSQHFLLNHLSGIFQAFPLPEAEKIFNIAKEKYPAAHEKRSFNDWLNYLTTHNLITQTAEGITITQYGKDFLKHLIDTNQTYERHG